MSGDEREHDRELRESRRHLHDTKSKITEITNDLTAFVENADKLRKSSTTTRNSNSSGQKEKYFESVSHQQ